MSDFKALIEFNRIIRECADSSISINKSIDQQIDHGDFTFEDASDFIAYIGMIMQYCANAISNEFLMINDQDEFCNPDAIMINDEIREAIDQAALINIEAQFIIEYSEKAI